MSYTYDRVKALKKGDIVWEGSQYGSIEVQLTEDPHIQTGGDGGEQVVFKATRVGSDRVIDYCFSANAMHYSPRMYDENPYMTHEQMLAKLNPPGMLSSKSNHDDSCNRQKNGTFCDCGFS